MTERHHNDPAPETLLQDMGDFCNSGTQRPDERVEELRPILQKAHQNIQHNSSLRFWHEFEVIGKNGLRRIENVVDIAVELMDAYDHERARAERAESELTWAQWDIAHLKQEVSAYLREIIDQRQRAERAEAEEERYRCALEDVQERLLPLDELHPEIGRLWETIGATLDPEGYAAALSAGADEEAE